MTVHQVYGALRWNQSLSMLEHTSKWSWPQSPEDFLSSWHILNRRQRDFGNRHSKQYVLSNITSGVNCVSCQIKVESKRSSSYMRPSDDFDSECQGGGGGRQERETVLQWESWRHRYIPPQLDEGARVTCVLPTLKTHQRISPTFLRNFYFISPTVRRL